LKKLPGKDSNFERLVKYTSTQTIIMKHAIIIILLCLLQSNCFSQPEKERLFAETVKEVIDAFSKQDSVAVTKFIDDKIGVYHLYSGNTYLNYEHLNAVSFTPPGRLVRQLNDCSNIHYSILQYKALPEWICNTEVWNKQGLFVDTTKVDHMLSEGCKFKNKYEPRSYLQKTIDFYWHLESISRRIVLQDEQKKEIVFYLSYINKEWYLTMIDNATSICSA
jgi:hypothetical protein